MANADRKTAPSRRSESELAAQVVAYLEGCGLDVYQEVEIRGVVIDIVAVTAHREAWAIEAKATWSLDLLEQCRDRRRLAHRVYAAVPAGRGPGHADLFEDNGIGVIVAGSSVNVRRAAPRISGHRRHGIELLRALRPGHKTHAKAGAPSAGGRYTPFAATCDALRDYVTRHPGATLKMAIDGIRHHYSSAAGARSTIAVRVRAGIVDGVELRDEDGKLRLWPAERAAA